MTSVKVILRKENNRYAVCSCVLQCFHVSFQQLVAQLRSDEELRAQAMAQEMCHCGIRVSDSELPQGWSVHRSQEAETKGRLFFVSGKLKRTILIKCTIREGCCLFASVRGRVSRLSLSSRPQSTCKSAKDGMGWAVNQPTGFMLHSICKSFYLSLKSSGRFYLCNVTVLQRTLIN